MTSAAGPVPAPSRWHNGSAWFNLRVIRDHSPTAMLAPSQADRDGLREFMRGYGVETVLDHLADPLTRLRACLSHPGGEAPSRFSDGSIPVAYMADSETGTLAEVVHHLARRLADTEAEKTRIHYFLLARFRLAGATLDVRRGFPGLHRPDDWAPAQAFGARVWAQGARGITYRSVRRRGAVDVAVFKADLVRSAARVKLVGLRWDGKKLAQV